MTMNRRYFLGAAGLAVAGGAARARAEANERVRLAVIGVRGRGGELISEFVKQKDAEVVAICDVDDAAFPGALKRAQAGGAKAPRTEKDFRHLLDDKDIDAVAIAAPDHWHALLTVFACQAGKDVYCEKPASHNIIEGRRMVEAARKYKRVVQLGTQRRSMPHVKDAVAFVQSGAIGKVGLARAWIHQKRKPIGFGEPGPVPAGVDYAMWQGPAPDRPFMSNRFHYNWHWFWNWGTAEVGNNGVHGVDVARWGLGVDAPLRVTSGGGKYVFDDDQEVPDTQVVTWEFPHAAIVWEHRMWSTHPLEGSGFGIAFYGDKGTVIVDLKGWHLVDGEEGAKKEGGKAEVGQEAHIRNFLDCLKSRGTPNADIEVGHLTTRMCLMGNIAHRVGRKLSFDAASETFADDADANKLLGREYSSRFEMPSQV